MALKLASENLVEFFGFFFSSRNFDGRDTNKVDNDQTVCFIHASRLDFSPLCVWWCLAQGGTSEIILPLPFSRVYELLRTTPLIVHETNRIHNKWYNYATLIAHQLPYSVQSSTSSGAKLSINNTAFRICFPSTEHKYKIDSFRVVTIYVHLSPLWLSSSP